MQSTEKHRTFIAIDLKSFYASAECVARGLNPLTTNLVVADLSRTDKTICLAVSPSLKAWGIGGRARLFEVEQRLRQVNNERRMNQADRRLKGKSFLDSELKAHPDWEVSYIAAPPRMALYMETSRRIYDIYLNYISPEDILNYSVDEVFIDVTHYNVAYRMSPHELAQTIIKQILRETGITATAGIGTNVFLSKVAMDIVAKHIPADENGVRIAELTEQSFQEQLWSLQPITKFWYVGNGTARRLAKYGITTMGQLAMFSQSHADVLYKEFGINAGLLIEHAWGRDPRTIANLREIDQTDVHSVSNGQVLQCPYRAEKARVVVAEMADNLALSLLSKKLVTNQVHVQIGYEALSRDNQQQIEGLTKDWYGRVVAKPSHGHINFKDYTSSSRLIREAVVDIFDREVDHSQLVRRLYVTATNAVNEETIVKKQPDNQLDFFAELDISDQPAKPTDEELKKERRLQETILNIKQKFGGNAILRGTNFMDGATGRERNAQIGGHKA